METHESHTNISGGRLRVHVEGVRMALRRAAEGVEARDARRQRDDISLARFLDCSKAISCQLGLSYNAVVWS